MKKAKLITSSAVVMTMVMSSIVPAFAYSKEETVYSKLKTNGSEKMLMVKKHLNKMVLVWYGKQQMDKIFITKVKQQIHYLFQ